MKKFGYVFVVLVLILVYFYFYPERCEQIIGNENIMCELGW
jgi:hypothetical protein